MDLSIFKKRSFLIITVILFIVLVLIIWQPVLPSSIVIEKMAESIDVKNLALAEEVVVRFDLSGRGGGVYNIVVNNEKAEMVEGETDRIDLILSMEASEFNDLMFSMASGEADELMFQSLIISNKLRLAGDMNILQNLFSSKGGK